VFCFSAVEAGKTITALGNAMKIYLLILLIGTLLTAIHYTSGPERQSETAPH
jgi:hypothetical protein